MCLCRAPERVIVYGLPHLGQSALGLPGGWAAGGLACMMLGDRTGGAELGAPVCACCRSVQSCVKSLPLGSENVRSLWHLGQIPRSFPVSGCL